MSETAIKVENVAKRFQINMPQATETIRGQLTSSLKAMLGHKRPQVEGQDYIWALRDISFELKRGEVLGVVGKNGSGKSTLLKILSRITPPTRGRLEITGRVASLLEVGTGFHPELSGRENVYMNAAILGMRREEIRRKFDEIVEFAEVAKFIDTPIKHYSSGMYMRLAFSVAAHLEQEILVVDEVLAVGDAAFQKKSLGKMDEVAHQGRTVLFVSHNTGALATLCPRSILLAEGVLLMDGKTSDIIQEYVKTHAEISGQREWDNPETAPGSDKARLKSVCVMQEGAVTAEVDIQKDVHLVFEFWNLSPGEKIAVGINLLDKVGVDVLTSANLHSTNLIVDPWFDKPLPVGVFRSTCVIPGDFLNEGRYSIHIALSTDITRLQVFEKNVIAFNVFESGGMSKEHIAGWLGVVRPRLAWQTEHIMEEVI